jgi:hypothetical protein
LRTARAYFPASFACHHDAAHRSNVRKLRQPGNDVADGVDARLGRLHPLVHRHKGAVQLNVHLIETRIVRPRSATHSDEDLFGLLHLRLTRSVGVAHLHPGTRLLDLLDLAARVHFNAALLVSARQFLRNLFVLYRHNARQRLDDRHIRPKALEDAGKLDAHRT